MGFTAAAEVALPEILGSSFAGDAAFTLGADAALSTPAFATAAGAADATAAALAGTDATAALSPQIYSDIPGQTQDLTSMVGGEPTQTAGYGTGGAQSTSVANPDGTTTTFYSDGSSATLNANGQVVGSTGGATSLAGQTVGSMAAPSSIPGILSTAASGAQVVGGLGQLYLMSQLLGGAGRVSPQAADPYAAYRSTNAAQLNRLLQDPSTITSTPGYQFNLSQGLNALQAQQAAQGRLVSGGGLLQAQAFGQQYATSSLAQQQDLLARLSGAYQSPASAATAQQGLGYGNIAATGLGLQMLGSGTANVLNPLATLYSQYNQPSPTVS